MGDYSDGSQIPIRSAERTSDPGSSGAGAERNPARRAQPLSHQEQGAGPRRRRSGRAGVSPTSRVRETSHGKRGSWSYRVNPYCTSALPSLLNSYLPCLCTFLTSTNLFLSFLSVIHDISPLPFHLLLITHPCILIKTFFHLAACS